ncbi:MAG TPA: hypothetical protein VFD60_00830 [Nitrososphaeraceae archaeon]|nr:hypothetical protein [Nitrososphaeraceae archaeon]
MSKQRFVELLANLREWSRFNGNEELDNHLNELDAEITAMDTPLSDTSDDSGGSTPPPDKERGG